MDGRSYNVLTYGRTAPKAQLLSQIDQSNILSAAQITNQLASTVVTLMFSNGETCSDSPNKFLLKILSLEPFSAIAKNMRKDKLTKVDASDSALATLKGIRALTELCSDDSVCQSKIADFGAFSLLRRFILQDDYERMAVIEANETPRTVEDQEHGSNMTGEASPIDMKDSFSARVPPTVHIRKHSSRLLMILSLLPKIRKTIIADEILCGWLEDCANGKIPGCNDIKIQSYARATLLNVFCLEQMHGNPTQSCPGTFFPKCPQYGDMIFFVNPESPNWKCLSTRNLDADAGSSFDESSGYLSSSGMSVLNDSIEYSDAKPQSTHPVMDVVFIHGLRGGPFKSWRIADNKSSTTSKAGLIEKIDQEAGKQGTCWPKEWLAEDLPEARLFTVKYKYHEYESLIE